MLDIITCPQWQARKPNGIIEHCGKSSRVILHHTAGHHAEIENPADESLAEAVRYAQAIQAFHMAPPPHGDGWMDSGHNFLVTRAGQVLQGRWLTVSSIQAGQMVISAHCPGQNAQVGVEHEHKGTELMTPAQREASALLMAWIARKYRKTLPLPIFPHRQFFATECPANLVSDIPKIYAMATDFLRQEAF